MAGPTEHLGLELEANTKNWEAAFKQAEFEAATAKMRTMIALAIEVGFRDFEVAILGLDEMAAAAKWTREELMRLKGVS